MFIVTKEMIETEKYMVFKCTKYKDLLTDFLTKLKTKTNLNIEDESSFLTSLMTTENYDIILFSTYISNCFHLRKATKN